MTSLNEPQNDLLIFGFVMVLAMLPTYLWSLFDSRTIRGVGIWVKPMKFMAALGVFAVTTVWLTVISGTAAAASNSFKWIAVVIVCNSSFEVGYIAFQASRGSASHYNRSDTLHVLLFGLMGIGAVALTASQAWLAWVIWTYTGESTISVTALGVLAGLVLTFCLSTVSGALLGGHQPPPGPGLPIVGWHLFRDIRPSHFLGVHAQQIIPAAGLAAERFLGNSAQAGFATFTAVYVLTWVGLTWLGLTNKPAYQRTFYV